MIVDVVLCAPPVLAVTRPSLGLGILKACLTARGIAARVEYANLSFADRFGVWLNEALAESIPTHLLAGDWIFAELLELKPEPDLSLALAARLSAVAGAAVWEAMQAVRRDVGFYIETTASKLVAGQPKVVGFSSTFQQTGAALALAAAVKRQAPATIVCMGGANCHGPMGRVLCDRFEQLDYVFTGEAEESFPELVSQLFAGRSQVTLPGVSQRNRPHPQSAPISDMQSVPMPDHDDYFAQLAQTSFGAAVAPSITFESSRGCWWGQKHHCTFCGLNAAGMRFRMKSSKVVRAEIDELVARYGYRRLMAADNIMAMDHIALFDGLRDDKRNYHFFYEIKANLDELALRRLASGGVTWVQPGIESSRRLRSASHAEGSDGVSKLEDAPELQGAWRRRDMEHTVRLSRGSGAGLR